MSDISITAANVIAGANAVTERGYASATVTAGQIAYKDPATGLFGLADNNSGTAAARAPYGVFLNGASANQPVVVQKAGDITIGGTLTAGVEYYLSATAGGLCPVADLSTGMYPAAIGIAKSTTVLALNIQASGVSL